MFLRTLLLASIACAPAMAVDSPPEGEKLLGTWEVEGSNPPETWDLLQEGDVQTVVRREAGKVTLNLRCKPVAGECHGTDGGKAATVTMYTKGPTLTHWEVKDTNLILRRFVGDGKSLTIEARQVTGQGRTRALRLVRRLATATRR